MTPQTADPQISEAPVVARADRRSAFFASYDLAAEILSGVPASFFDRPTPCPEFDVARLVSHLVFAAQRAASLGRGDVARVDSDSPDIDPSQSHVLILSAKKEAQDAWADASRLEATAVMPWGETYDGYTLVDMYLAELTAHTWDVAASTGQLPVLAQTGAQLAGPALAAARAMLKPEYRNLAGPGSPFGSEIAVADDAGDWARFAGFMGRDPRAVHGA